MSSDVGPLLSGSYCRVAARSLTSPAALLSIDIESDFGTGERDALNRLETFLDVVDNLAVPLTAFVEGQLFRRSPETWQLLVERGVDVQLHVYDHAATGDTPESLRRGVDAYGQALGRLPEGYRAHSCRLTPSLFGALVALGFKWDASIMRGYGLGHNGDRAFLSGDYYVLGDGLFEFPVGVWRGVRLPLNHPYTMLVGRPLGAVLRRVSGPAGNLVGYNVHMTDLERVAALDRAPYGALFRALQRWMWVGQGTTSYGHYRDMCAYLGGRGYRFSTTSALYREVVAVEGEPVVAPPGAPAYSRYATRD